MPEEQKNPVQFQPAEVPYLTPDIASLQPIVDFITSSPIPNGMSYNDVHTLIGLLTGFAEIAVFNFNKLKESHGEEPWTADEIRAMGVPVMDAVDQG